MDAKLTLNMDREIAGKAKKYARSKGRSLSDLVEDYLRFLTSQMESEELQICLQKSNRSWDPSKSRRNLTIRRSFPGD